MSEDKARPPRLFSITASPREIGRPYATQLEKHYKLKFHQIIEFSKQCQSMKRLTFPLPENMLKCTHEDLAYVRLHSNQIGRCSNLLQGCAVVLECHFFAHLCDKLLTRNPNLSGDTTPSNCTPISVFLLRFDRVVQLWECQNGSKQTLFHSCTVKSVISINRLCI